MSLTVKWPALKSGDEETLYQEDFYKDSVTAAEPDWVKLKNKLCVFLHVDDLCSWFTARKLEKMEKFRCEETGIVECDNCGTGTEDSQEKVLDDKHRMVERSTIKGKKLKVSWAPILKKIRTFRKNERLTGEIVPLRGPSVRMMGSSHRRITASARRIVAKGRIRKVRAGINTGKPKTGTAV